MSREDLVPTLVSKYRFQGEVIRISVTLKCLGVDGQLIDSRHAPASILCATGLAVKVLVFNSSDKSKIASNPHDSFATLVQFSLAQRHW